MSKAGWKASFVAMGIALGERADLPGEPRDPEAQARSGTEARLARARAAAEVLLALVRDVEARRLA